MPLKARINEDMKAAMRAREAAKLSAIRLLLAAIKQREIDERVELSDPAAIAVVEKLIKQRQDSISQFETAKRQDLVEKEKFELSVLVAYLPQRLTDPEVEALIAQAIDATQASGMKDMGKVMAVLRQELAGRADMSKVSSLLKTKLTT